MLKQDFLQDFLFTLVIKIGAQDIQNDIITAQLILNETMEVNPEKKDVLEKVKQKNFSIKCEQYAKIGVKKPQIFELREEGVTEAHIVEYNFA